MLPSSVCHVQGAGITRRRSGISDVFQLCAPGSGVPGRLNSQRSRCVVLGAVAHVELILVVDTTSTSVITG